MFRGERVSGWCKCSRLRMGVSVGVSVLIGNDMAKDAATMDRMWGGDAIGAGLDPEIVTTRLR